MRQWVRTARDIVVFVLGAILILDAVFGFGRPTLRMLDMTLELVIGLLLIGVVPLEVILDKFIPKSKPVTEDDITK